MQDRNIALPKFTGSENPEGYFEAFELLCDQLQSTEGQRKAYLLSKLEGAARALVFGQGKKALQLDYNGLKALLLDHFLGESTTYCRKL